MSTGRRAKYGALCNHSKCALRPDEKMLEVVTGIVFAQACEKIEHTTIMQNHFNTAHEITHRAISERRRAACSGYRAGGALGRRAAAAAAGAASAAGFESHSSRPGMRNGPYPVF